MRAFQTILVPVDYSAGSATALRSAATLARSVAGRLVVLYLLPIEVYGLGDYPIVAGDGARMSAERERLDAWVRATVGDPLPAYEVEVEWGSPYFDIVHVAAERRADLIVIGTHGRTGFRHLLLGSVAEKTVRLAPCPVLTVHAETDVEGLPAGAPKGPPTAEPVHPGEVATRMRRAPLTIGSGEMLETARTRMAEAGIRHLPVVDGDALVGMLSDKDLGPYVGYLARTKVNTVMTAVPATITPDASIATAARLMLARRVRALPVTEGARLVGILTSTDILEEYIHAARTA